MYAESAEEHPASVSRHRWRYRFAPVKQVPARTIKGGVSPTDFDMGPSESPATTVLPGRD